jgi:hypothetical protein
MIKFNKLSRKAKKEVAECYLYRGHCHAIAKKHGLGYRLDFVNTLDEMPNGWKVVESVSREELETHLSH